MTINSRAYYNFIMLTVEWCEDKKILDSLSLAALGRPAAAESGAVLAVDGNKCGVAFFTLDSDIHISAVGVLPEYRGKGYGDFFTRVLLYKFMFYKKDIVVDCVDGYYTKLGFKQDGESMRASCDDIVFPSYCAHNGGYND